MLRELMSKQGQGRAGQQHITDCSGMNDQDPRRSICGAA